MRISTSTMYSDNVFNMNQLQVQLAQTQQQISTGRRIINPADDPAAAAQAIELKQSDAANTQFSSNRAAATNTLSLSESTLQSVTLLLQDVKTTAVNAGNAILNQSDRNTLATNLQGRLQELMSLANTTDGAGSYLYSGAQGGVQPFANTAAGVVYQGDDIQRNIQVGISRQMATSDSGDDIFMRIKNGNGTFLAAPVAANTGSGVISSGTVTNPALYSGNSYQVTFAVAAGVTTYSINDVTAGPPGVAVAGQTGIAYVSGQQISFNGIQFGISGAPANGDVFNVTPGTNQSIFTTISNLIHTLNTPVVAGNAASNAAYQQGINDALSNVDQGLNNVLNIRATLGGRMKEVDALQVTGDTLGVQYKQTLSKLQDVDYNKAISDFTQQQMVLSAAQKSFAQVSKMSLFSYL